MKLPFSWNIQIIELMHADIIYDFIQIDFIPRENTLHLSDTMAMTDRREMVASRYYNPFRSFHVMGYCFYNSHLPTHRISFL